MDRDCSNFAVLAEIQNGYKKLAYTSNHDLPFRSYSEADIDTSMAQLLCSAGGSPQQTACQEIM